MTNVLGRISAVRVRTLADGLSGGNDNFLLLRLIAASLVIYGHGPAFTRLKGWPDLFTWLGWGTYSGDLAVDVFFVASGFMIAGSYLRRKHLLDFLWARFIRIYPAYAICIFALAFILGPIYSDLPLDAYYRDHDVIRYVSRNISLSPRLIWTLPGVFGNNHIPYVNGSIWTLPAEVRMYLWVALGGVTGILSWRNGSNLLLAALLIVGLWAPSHLPLVPLAVYVRLAGYFGLGVFCYVNRAWIPVGWPWTTGFALLAWLLHGTMFYPFAFGLALTMFVFAFGYATPWYGFNRLGDYSYGLYLWGFPMQQVVAYHVPSFGPFRNALVAWALALAIAIFSWHVVEKPLLKLKQIPSRVHAKLRLFVQQADS
jgi:peptidoglycan/LPS O-acetylase OafA/YrhL